MIAVVATSPNVTRWTAMMGTRVAMTTRTMAGRRSMSQPEIGPAPSATSRAYVASGASATLNSLDHMSMKFLTLREMFGEKQTKVRPRATLVSHFLVHYRGFHHPDPCTSLGFTRCVHGRDVALQLRATTVVQ